MRDRVSLCLDSPTPSPSPAQTVPTGKESLGPVTLVDNPMTPIGILSHPCLPYPNSHPYSIHSYRLPTPYKNVLALRPNCPLLFDLFMVAIVSTLPVKGGMESRGGEDFAEV